MDALESHLIFIMKRKIQNVETTLICKELFYLFEKHIEIVVLTLGDNGY
ncbi:hypothetical protein TCT1_20190 [Xenorhabdus sp. TCT-1]|uniref:Transposase n=1 Tax=Xenorhabdus taiwanensis TaxID=3085177 RepID=A0ABN7C434_9GAMM|nr:hypothetical protein TCT1_20190 [Xenorhabdus sp. TCT-1]